MLTLIFTSVFLAIFKKNQHNGRVILPLLKTITLLMNRVCIDQLINDTLFSATLSSRLREEEADCKDVHRLTAIVNVSLGLLGSTNKTQKDSLAFVCKMLMHPFPRVRRIAAENFYIRLIEDPERDSNDPALALLLTNPWDGDEPDSKVREMAMEVAKALGVDSLML